MRKIDEVVFFFPNKTNFKYLIKKNSWLLLEAVLLFIAK